MRIFKNKTFVLYVFIPIVSLLTHLHIFNLDLIGSHVWRQTQTQTTIDNFFEEDFNILNPRVNNRGAGAGILRMEFPIMQWLFAAAYHIFGNDIIVTRILSFLLSLITVFGIFHLVYYLSQNTILSLIAAWTFNFSPIFYYYAVNPMPDNFALSAAVWSLVFFLKWEISPKKLHLLLLMSFFLGISVLSKLPFITYSSIIITSAFFNVRKYPKRAIQIIGILIISLIPAINWYIWSIPTWGDNPVVKGIFNNVENQLQDFLFLLQSNFVSTLPEFLINYGSVPFFLLGIYSVLKKRLYTKPVFKLLAVLGISVLLYFFYILIAIGRSHSYYLFPFLPLIFILVSYGAYELYGSGIKYKKIFFVFLMLILPLTAYLRSRARWDLQNPRFNKDLLTYRQELRDAIPNDALCIVGNDISPYIFLYYVHKKGWVFKDDEITDSDIQDMINQGAQYIYFDSPKIEKDKKIFKQLDSLILKRGSIKVYSLKPVKSINFD